MDDSDRNFIAGAPNPRKFGFKSLMAVCGSEPDQEALDQACQILSRPIHLRDARGYECDIIAATVHPAGDRVAYVESRSKKSFWSHMVDISIKVNLWEAGHLRHSVDIESYNPFFGCDVSLFLWIDDTALLIYHEKHYTYVCTCSVQSPPRYVKIEDRWLIQDGVLNYIGYQKELVNRLSVPELVPLPPLSLADAQAAGTLPPDPYQSR